MFKAGFLYCTYFSDLLYANCHFQAVYSFLVYSGIAVFIHPSGGSEIRKRDSRLQTVQELMNCLVN